LREISDFDILSAVKGRRNTNAAANLTTRDVAGMLLVSEATVKRWADDGLLLPQKTVGGHRRFSVQSVSLFRGEQGNAPDLSPTKSNGKKKVPGRLP
jgi:hypothetical protein